MIAIHREAARSGSFADWPDHLDRRLLAVLDARDLKRAYTHQEIALRAIEEGRDVVLSTSTASGKSICYQLPIANAALASDDTRALMLFPTKALGRDQVESFRRLLGGIEGAPTAGIGVAVYDGDTPPDARRAARGRAHAVATNPDMLHRGILPHHEAWARFLSGLRYVVLDELHTYRGLFGSHIANVLRRLWRLCAYYGSNPQLIASSATIANPGELASALSGCQDVQVIDGDGAPTGERTFVLLNPEVVDPLTGVRRDYVKVTRQVATMLRREGVQTLVFCRTRKAVELLTRYLRDDAVAEARGPVLGPNAAKDAAQSIRGYRGGYLPERRREVEKALRGGEAQVVATTNALELGIDIGGVDAVVLSGYPGTRAQTLQRAGRAGRRGRASLVAMCLSSTPLDQFVAADPSFLWGKPPEHARVDPDNPEVFLPHLRAATSELPFGPGDPLRGVADDDLAAALAYLADRGAIHREDDEHGPTFLGTGGPSPAEAIELRGSIEENFAVIEDRSGEILAEVAFEDAPLYIHPGAIYTIEGRTHEVVRLDWDARKAFVRRVKARYYTEAIPKTRVRIVDVPEERAAPAHGQGYAHLVRTVPGFKKIRFGSHENIGFGPINLPDLELHTSAAFWAMPDGVAAELSDPTQRAAAALAAAHAIHHVAAMLLMCDSGDLGHLVTAGHPSAWGAVLVPGRRPSTESVLAASARPYLLLFDRIPGGAGLASTAHAMGRAVFDRAAKIVAGCSCEQGCPTCMGPASDEDWAVRRGHVVELLAALAAQAQDGA